MPSKFRGRMAWSVAALALIWGPGLRAALGQGEAEGLSASFREAARRVLPAVVTVRPGGLPGAFEVLPETRPRPILPSFVRPDLFGPGLAPSGASSGSGVVIDADRGYVLTTDHLVRGVPGIVVTLADGRERAAIQVRSDLQSDLALVIIDGKGLTQAQWGDSDALDLGDWVLALGRPVGLSDSVSAGIVSGRGRGIGADFEDLIRTDAAIPRGLSGGPLVNLRGEVVGINDVLKAHGGYERIGFAIPAARARRIATDLAEHGRVRRAYIGVLSRVIDRGEVERLDQPSAALITEVMPRSPAEEAGLRPGDIILGIKGRPVTGPGAVQAAIEFAPAGEPLTVTIDHDGERREVEVRPRERSEVIEGPGAIPPQFQDRPLGPMPPEPVPPNEEGPVNRPSRTLESTPVRSS